MIKMRKLEKTIAKQERRKSQNRESALRCRLKKQNTIVGLSGQVDKLQRELDLTNEENRQLKSMFHSQQLRIV